MGNRYGDNANSWQLGSHTTVDFSLWYTMMPTQLGDSKPLPEITPHHDIADIGSLVESALNAIVELDIRSISLNRGGYVFVTDQTDSILVRDRANKIYINPHTQEVIYAQRAADLPLYWLWSNMADPLHFGNFYGWVKMRLKIIRP